MRRKKRGHPEDIRNRGYLYRKSHRLWCTNLAGRFVPLVDEKGERLRDQDCPVAKVRDAYDRFRCELPKQSASGTGATLEQVCNYYFVD